MAAIVSGSLAVGAGIPAADPIIGTWKVNVSKSKFEPGPPLRSEVFVASLREDGRLSFTADWVDGDGTQGHLQWSTALDGKANPAWGSTDYDSVADKRTETGYKSVFKKGAVVIERETNQLSADHKTIRARIRGTPPDAAPYALDLVFERQ